MTTYKLALISFGIIFLNIITGCKKACIEKQREDCFCTAHIDPVCGCNNVTYSNACEAWCSGITEYKSGSCK
jgi:hypothetical protein